MLRIAKLSSLILGALLLVTVAKADDHGKTHVDVHGALDVFWNTNMNGGQTGGAYTPLSHDDVGVGLAMLSFAGSVKHVDYYFELARGTQTATVTAAAGGADLTQAYLTSHINDQLSVSAGRMATNFGFEGAFAKDNWNYSRSIGFANGGPFFHEGIAVKYNHNSGLGLGLFYYDGTDQLTQGEPTHATSLQLSYGRDNWAVVYNYYADKDGLNKLIHNVNFTYDVNSELSLALSHIMGEVDEDNNDDAWTSTAIYAKYMYSKKAYAALRYEMWNDEDGAVFSTGTGEEDLTSITLTGGWYCDSGSEMRLEVRQDSADSDLFVDEDGAAEDSQMNVSASWIHTF